jgi:hypothetical protein
MEEMEEWPKSPSRSGHGSPGLRISNSAARTELLRTGRFFFEAAHLKPRFTDTPRTAESCLLMRLLHQAHHLRSPIDFPPYPFIKKRRTINSNQIITLTQFPHYTGYKGIVLEDGYVDFVWFR